MLYRILKFVVRLAMLIFCRRIVINHRSMLEKHGPLLLASNHPNSFLDAILFDILFEQPIWSLARGDVFKNRFITRALSALRILPVYRVSEGVENLNNNYETFDACKQIFREKGIVLIFSEGKCVNEWRLRPLRKGTARLAINSWDDDIPLQVLPVGINYNSFRRFGKNVIINFGNIISKDDIPQNASDGLRFQAFNTRLEKELASLVYEIKEDDIKTKKQLLEHRPTRSKTYLLGIPASLGWLFHLPLYIPVQKMVHSKTAHNDHYDSILAAALLVIYPVYLLLITALIFYFSGSYYSFLLLLLLPFTAWCYVQLKEQLDL